MIGERRRAKQTLEQLDRVLEALEYLNLNEQRYPSLYAQLIELGIPEPWRFHPTQLIEMVWVLQEPHLLTPPTRISRRQYSNGTIREVVITERKEDRDRFLSTVEFRKSSNGHRQ